MKKLFPFLIIISLFCFQITKVSALDAVIVAGDPISWPAWATQLAGQATIVGKTIITAGSSLRLEVKEYALDPAAKIMADLALTSAKTSALNWVNSGFKGNPTFISNPDIYFQNIATGVVRTNVSDLASSNSPFSGSVASALVAKTRNSQSSLSEQLTPTLSTAVQNDVCTDTKLTDMAKKYMSAGVSIGGDKSLDVIKKELRNELCNSDATNKVQQTKLNDCFATDFNCGGWGAWLKLTSDPKNTLTGQIIAANTITSQTQDSKKEDVKTITTPGGMLAITNCVDTTSFYQDPKTYDPNKPPCKNAEVTTPASTVENTAKIALDSGWTSLANAHELGDVLTGVLTGSLSGLMGKGLSSMGNGGQRVTLDTLSGAGPVDVTPTNTTIPSSAPEEMTPEKRDSLIKTINNQLNLHLSSAKSLRDINNSYISTENNYLSQLNSLSACYDQALAIYPSYVKADSRYIAGRSFIADKTQTYNAKIQELSSEVVLANTTISEITAIKNQLANVVEASKIIDIYTNYQNKNSSGYYVGDQEYATRNVEILSNKQIVETDTTTLNNYLGTNGIGFGNFNNSTGCVRLKIDAQTALDALQGNSR